MSGRLPESFADLLEAAKYAADWLRKAAAEPNASWQIKRAQALVQELEKAIAKAEGKP